MAVTPGAPDCVEPASGGFPETGDDKRRPYAPRPGSATVIVDSAVANPAWFSL